MQRSGQHRCLWLIHQVLRLTTKQRLAAIGDCRASAAHLAIHRHLLPAEGVQEGVAVLRVLHSHKALGHCNREAVGAAAGVGRQADGGGAAWQLQNGRASFGM